MLNRLYIVIGVVVILALAAAFVVPHLVPWGNYRARMEALAGQALGTPVKIKGDIAFSLLPAPHLTLGDVEIGPPQQPVLSVGAASADFSLIDFLRDRYSMTSLVLDHPELRAGKRVPVSFRILDAKAEPVTAYTPTHDKELHLIAVRRDLSGFQHVHPTRDAAGTWSAAVDLTPGAWRFFADFDPAGDTEPVTLGAETSPSRNSTQTIAPLRTRARRPGAP